MTSCKADNNNNNNNFEFLLKITIESCFSIVLFVNNFFFAVGVQ